MNRKGVIVNLATLLGVAWFDWFGGVRHGEGVILLVVVCVKMRQNSIPSCELLKSISCVR